MRQQGESYLRLLSSDYLGDETGGEETKDVKARGDAE
jgi:hypothetical protein